MKLSFIINNFYINYFNLYNILKQFSYNPIVLEFDEMYLFYKNIKKKHVIFIIIIIITELSENNEIIYKNKNYCIKPYLNEISKLNIKTFIFFDYYSRNKRKEFKHQFPGISLMFSTKEIDKSKNSILLNSIIKHIKQKEMSEELFKEIFNDIKK